MKVTHVIYGFIEEALQWYIMFIRKLKELWCKLNPYDKCVANKTVNGKQSIIAWHVDDAIASHVEQEV